jgi:hypothetical protein
MSADDGYQSSDVLCSATATQRTTTRCPTVTEVNHRTHSPFASSTNAEYYLRTG